MPLLFFSLQTDIPGTEITEVMSQPQSTTALEFLMKGGIFIIPILILLFYTIYVIIERFLFIRKSTKYNASLINDIRNELSSGKIESARTICFKDNSATGNVLASGIDGIGRPVSEIESRMEKATNIEIGEMEKKMGHLGLIAGIAPTLGFIGTISGVIKIFHDISVSEDISIGNISGGLYEKMISSGAGLVVGVVAYSAYHLFNGRIDSFVLNIQKQVLEFLNIINQPSYASKKE
ncbi:MAG: MotA/TolQ/ExbB proton channel family protein [Bacteroidota bacterium]|nr:MotA/TolQ/ExbB proton channel family protein [Bacteroidota bacterium]